MLRRNPVGEAATLDDGVARCAQADGTAWMAFYCVVMLDIALELAEVDPTYEDMASKFFEHFIHIMDAINSAGQGEGARKEMRRRRTALCFASVYVCLFAPKH